MTFRELSDECWRDLPTIRKWIAGRDVSDKLLADAIREFEPDRVGSAGYDNWLLDRVTARNQVRDGEGFVLLTFLLVTVAAAVISWLIQRWLDYQFPREQLEEWRRELST